MSAEAFGRDLIHLLRGRTALPVRPDLPRRSPPKSLPTTLLPVVQAGVDLLEADNADFRGTLPPHARRGGRTG